MHTIFQITTYLNSQPLLNSSIPSSLRITSPYIQTVLQYYGEETWWGWNETKKWILSLPSLHSTLLNMFMHSPFNVLKKKYVPNSERNPEVLLGWHMLQLGGIRPMKIDSRESIQSTKSMSDYLDWKKMGLVTMWQGTIWVRYSEVCRTVRKSSRTSTPKPLLQLGYFSWGIGVIQQLPFYILLGIQWGEKP